MCINFKFVTLRKQSKITTLNLNESFTYITNFNKYEQ